MAQALSLPNLTGTQALAHPAWCCDRANQLMFEGTHLPQILAVMKSNLFYTLQAMFWEHKPVSAST